MKNTIKCKHCGKEIEISEALRHEFEESIAQSLSKKHLDELKKVREDVEKEVLEKAKLQVTTDLTDKENQIEELKKRVSKAEDEELKIRREKRELEEARQKFELEKQRQLDEERENIRRKVASEIEEKDRFRFAEYEKKISDMSKSLAEATQKANQGSQQLQGEVLELDLEKSLADTFLDDEVIGVAKGQKGGDIIHKVKGKTGKVAGIILWETKRAKWSNTWISKLKEDARKVEASISVLLSTDLPSEIVDFRVIEGVVVCSYKHAIPLASILRRSVLQVAVAKQTASSKDENLESLYEYIQSESFRHRFESFAEGIKIMGDDLEYEKRAMERIWKKREMQIKNVLVNASRMYGELQGVMKNALPDIKTFSLSDGSDVFDEKS